VRILEEQDLATAELSPPATSTPGVALASPRGFHQFRCDLAREFDENIGFQINLERLLENGKRRERIRIRGGSHLLYVFEDLDGVREPEGG
jgi:hypothetical protein